MNAISKIRQLLSSRSEGSNAAGTTTTTSVSGDTVKVSDGSTFCGTFHDAAKKKPKYGMKTLKSGEVHTGDFDEATGRLKRGRVVTKLMIYDGEFAISPKFQIHSGSATSPDGKVELIGRFNTQTSSFDFGFFRNEPAPGTGTHSFGYFVKPPKGQTRVTVGQILFKQSSASHSVVMVTGIYNPDDARVILGLQCYTSERQQRARFQAGKVVFASGSGKSPGSILAISESDRDETTAFHDGIRSGAKSILTLGYSVQVGRYSVAYPESAMPAATSQRFPVPLTPHLASVLGETERVTSEELRDYAERVSVELNFDRRDAPDSFDIGPSVVCPPTGQVGLALHGFFSIPTQTNPPSQCLRFGEKLVSARGIGVIGTSSGKPERSETGIYGAARMGCRTLVDCATAADGASVTLTMAGSDGVMVRDRQSELVHGYAWRCGYVSPQPSGAPAAAAAAPDDEDDDVAAAGAASGPASVDVPRAFTLANDRVAPQVRAFGAMGSDAWAALAATGGMAAMSGPPLSHVWVSVVDIAAMIRDEAEYTCQVPYADRVDVAALDAFVAEVSAGGCRPLIDLTYDENAALERAYLRGDPFAVLARGRRRATLVQTADVDLHGCFKTSERPDFFAWTGAATTELPNGARATLYRVPCRIVSGLGGVATSEAHERLMLRTPQPGPSAEPSTLVLPHVWTLINARTGQVAATFGFDEAWLLEAACLASAKLNPQNLLAPVTTDASNGASITVAFASAENGSDDGAATFAMERGSVIPGCVAATIASSAPLRLYLTHDAPESLRVALGGGDACSIAASALRFGLFPHSVSIATGGCDAHESFELRRQALTATEMTALPFYSAAWLRLHRAAGTPLHFGTPHVDDVAISVSELDRVGGVAEAITVMRGIAYLHGGVCFASHSHPRLITRMSLDSIERPWMPRFISDAHKGPDVAAAIVATNTMLQREARRIREVTYDQASLRWPFLVGERAIVRAEAPSLDVDANGNALDAGAPAWSSSRAESSFLFGGETEADTVARAHHVDETDATLPPPSTAGHEEEEEAAVDITVRFAATSTAALNAMLHDALRWLVNAERISTPDEWASAQPAAEGEPSAAVADVDEDDGAATAEGDGAAAIATATASQCAFAPAAAATAATAEELDEAGVARAQVRRVAGILGIDLPADLRLPGHGVLLHFVAPASAEFTAVTASFGENSFKNKVLCVQRVQNRVLWEKYVVHTRQVAKENGGDANEVAWMKHGTRTTPPLTICTTGFDHRYCEAGMYGRATYFAYSSHYSNLFRHDVEPAPLADGNVVGQLILARVTKGRVEKRTVSDKDLKRPAAGCHCVEGPVTTTGTPAVMTYDLNQAYPAYVVSYVIPPGTAQKNHATPMSVAAAAKKAQPKQAAPTPAAKTKTKAKTKVKK